MPRKARPGPAAAPCQDSGVPAEGGRQVPWVHRPALGKKHPGQQPHGRQVALCSPLHGKTACRRAQAHATRLSLWQCPVAFVNHE